MQGFHYSDDRLYAEDVALTSIADRFSTPCYVYSRAMIEGQWRAYQQALSDRPHLICYAVKANSNLAILDLLAGMGSGFDVVSGGELERVIRAGGEPGRTVFSGIGKTRAEMEKALSAGIKSFNVESAAELQLLNKVAGETGFSAPVSIRVNPDVDAGTHPYISTGLRQNKFGIDINEAESIYLQAASMQHVDIAGIDCHIGSQITTLGPYRDACTRLMTLVKRLESQGIELRHIDIGGGLGISYQNETPPSHAELIQSVNEIINNDSYELLIEPGRSVVGKAGVLLTRVLYLKHTTEKNFAIVDAAMNDLLRPALYDAWQGILPVAKGLSHPSLVYDVVGPVCETGDFLGHDRTLAIAENDLLAVTDAGAYGFSMSSNYNSRPRVAEVLVDRDQVHEIRPREQLADLYRDECILPTGRTG